MSVPPSPRVSVPPPDGFSGLWRLLLPAAVLVMATALLFGLFDTTARPAWIFLVGAGIGLVGLASLGRRLYVKSRRGLEELESEFEKRFGEETKR